MGVIGVFPHEEVFLSGLLFDVGELCDPKVLHGFAGAIACIGVLFEHLLHEVEALVGDLDVDFAEVITDLGTDVFQDHLV